METERGEQERKPNDSVLDEQLESDWIVWFFLMCYKDY